MSRIAIARKDLQHTIRDRLAWGAVVLLGLMFLPSTASVATSSRRPISEFLLMMPFDLITFALVVVAAIGYNSVAGERASGSIRFVLSLPSTRRDLVLGKLLSRTVIVLFALTVILAIANALVVRGYGKPYLAPFWVMATWMLVYGAVWTAITVGYSAAFSSQYRTLGALLVTYITFSPNFGVWSVVVRPLFALVFTGSFSVPTYDELAAAPLWLRVIERFNPLVNFWEAMRWSIELVGPGTPLGGPIPNVLGTAVFLLFGAVPLVYGCLRFQRTDLSSEPPGLQLGDRLWRSLSSVSGIIITNRSESDRQISRVWTIAREDVRHALQNWVVMGGMVVTMLIVGPNLWQTLDPTGIWSTSSTLASIPNQFSLPTLVLGIAVGYRAVVGEREAGTAKLLLGLPATRRDIVLGKLLSRVTIAVCTLLPLLLFAELLVLIRFDAVYPAEFLAWSGSVLMLGVVWTSVVVGFSAAFSSHYRTLAATFGTFLLFSQGVGLWGSLMRPLFAFLVTGKFTAEDLVSAGDRAPLWYRLTDHLNPLVALGTIQDGILALSGIEEVSHPTTALVVYSVITVFLFIFVILYTGNSRFSQSRLG